jgi:hypothetical protein
LSGCQRKRVNSTHRSAGSSGHVRPVGWQRPNARAFERTSAGCPRGPPSRAQIGPRGDAYLEHQRCASLSAAPTAAATPPLSAHRSDPAMGRPHPALILAVEQVPAEASHRRPNGVDKLSVLSLGRDIRQLGPRPLVEPERGYEKGRCGIELTPRGTVASPIRFMVARPGRAMSRPVENWTT